LRTRRSQYLWDSLGVPDGAKKSELLGCYLTWGRDFGIGLETINFGGF